MERLRSLHLLMRLLLVGALASTLVAYGCDDGDGSDGDGDADGDSDGDSDGDGDGDGEICDNGIDDDGNSLEDCEDFACFDDPACQGGDGDADGDSDGDGDGDGDADYPAAPYGFEVGDVIANLSFDPGNDTAIEMAGDDGVFEFSDLYAMNVEHGGDATGLMVFVTAGW